MTLKPIALRLGEERAVPGGGGRGERGQRAVDRIVAAAQRALASRMKWLIPT